MVTESDVEGDAYVTEDELKSLDTAYCVCDVSTTPDEFLWNVEHNT